MSAMTHRQAVALLRSAGHTIRAAGDGQHSIVTDPAGTPHRLTRAELILRATNLTATLEANGDSTGTYQQNGVSRADQAQDAPNGDSAGTYQQNGTSEASPAPDATPPPAPNGDSAGTYQQNDASEASPLPRRGSTPTYPLSFIGAALTAHAAQFDGRTLDPQRNVIPLPPRLARQFDVGLDLLIRCRFQPRKTFRQEALDELAASISAHGVLTRLLIFANEYGELELIAGERRMRAATQAGMEAVPVELFSGTLSQIAEIAAIENVQREDLTPLEEGASYEQLISELGISEAELARRLGKPRTYVQQRRMLVRAAPELQQALSEEAVSFTQLRAVLQAAPGDHKAQREALKELRSRSTAGQRVTEDAAREIAEREVLKGSAKALKQLGWQSRRRPRGDILLWSEGDRPSVTAGAELLDILRSGRRPTPPTLFAERPLSAEQEALLRVRGYRLNNKEYAPWIAVSEGWAEPDRWLTPAEVADELLPSIAADIAELQAAYRAEGWAFKVADGTLTVVGEKHGTVQNPYDWGRARQVLEEIRRGAIVDSPQPKTSGSQAASRRACQDGRVCGKKKHRIDTMTHLDGKFVCAACRDAIAAAEAALREQCDAATDLRAIPWAAACPADLLRLFILGAMGSSKRLGFEQHDTTDKKLQIIAAQSRAELEAALVDVLRYIAWRYRETPLALDLAAPVAPPVPADSPAAPPAVAPEEPPPLSERFADIAFAINDAREFDLPMLERWRDQLQALYIEACADPDDLDLAALSRDIDLLIGEIEGWISAASQAEEVEHAQAA